MAAKKQDKAKAKDGEQKMIGVTATQVDYVTKCPQCGGPLLNVSPQHCLCPAGCGGLHPALVGRDARISKKLVAGKMVECHPVEALRLTAESCEYLWSGASRQLWAVSGRRGLWVRLPGTRDNRRVAAAVQGINEKTGHVVTLIPLSTWDTAAVRDAIAAAAIKRLSTDTPDEVHPWRGVMDGLGRYADAYELLWHTMAECDERDALAREAAEEAAALETGFEVG